MNHIIVYLTSWLITICETFSNDRQITLSSKNSCHMLCSPVAN